MTDVEQTQYERYRVAGYDPATARALVERGAWLQTAYEFVQGMDDAAVAQIRRYREEREVAKRADLQRDSM